LPVKVTLSNFLQTFKPKLKSHLFIKSVRLTLNYYSAILGSVKVTTERQKLCNMSRMNFSGYVGHVTIFG